MAAAPIVHVVVERPKVPGPRQATTVRQVPISKRPAPLPRSGSPKAASNAFGAGQGRAVQKSGMLYSAESPLPNFLRNDLLAALDASYSSDLSKNMAARSLSCFLK